ncbi:MAG: hypothetical protein IJ449_02400 [Clostridia bacterium]|nr:hypothetical protein [Clostridia bacterium]
MKRLVCILLLAFCILGLCSCRDNDIGKTEYVYTEDYLKIKEPGGDGFLVSGNVKVCADGGYVYRFTSDIPENIGNMFIATHKILEAYLLDNGVPQDECVTIHLLVEKSSFTQGEENTVWLSLSDLGTQKHVLAVLSALWGRGEYTNYGYLYALSDKISRDLGWSTDGDAGTPDNALFAEKPELCSLVYPCFLTDFYSEEKISACRALACEVLSRMEDPFAGEDAFLSELAAYISAILPTTGVLSENEFFFAFGGDAIPLKIRTPYFTIERTTGYTAGVLAEGEELTADVRADDPLYNFPLLLDVLSSADEAVEVFHAAFSAAGYECPEAPFWVQLVSDGEFSFYSYENGVPLMRTDSVYYPVRGYVWYAAAEVFNNGGTVGTWENWRASVLYSYFAKEEMFRTQYALSRHRGALDSLGEKIGEPFDDVDDELKFISAMLATSEDTLSYELKTTNRAAMPFAGYLADNYGEEVMIQCMMEPERAESLTGMSLDGLIRHWTAEMQK